MLGKSNRKGDISYAGQTGADISNWVSREGLAEKMALK